MNKKFIKGIVLLATVIVVLNSAYMVKENEYAYKTRFSKYVGIENTAGLKFKIPILDTIEILPKYKMSYDMPPSDVLTGDKKTLVVDNFVVWQIDDPLTFMRTVGRITEIENRIGAVVYNAVKNTLGTMNQTDIINSDNTSVDAVNKKITDIVNNQLTSYGVSIVSNAEIKRLDLPPENEGAVYKRMVSERNQMTETYIAEGKLEAKKLENETDKDVEIIKSKALAEAEELRGQGESEYMRIISEAYGTPDRVEFYNFLRSLEALEKSLKGEKTVILPADNPLVRTLNGK